MTRLIKKALNDVLKDSFNPKVNEDDKEEIIGVDEPPVNGQEIEPINPKVEDDGLGEDSKTLEDGLVEDICSLQLLYQQIKLFHWITNGSNYIAVHRFFDEIADAILEQVDLMAERLVFLEIQPVAELEEISKKSYVKFTEMEAFKFDGAISVIDDGLNLIIDKMKGNSQKAGDSRNIGTEKMLQDFVYDLEVLQHHIRSFRG